MNYQQFIISLIALSGLFAQNIHAQVFWTEDFAQGIPADWTNVDAVISVNILNPSDTIRAIWQYCDRPQNCPPYILEASGNPTGIGLFAAKSAENGYVFVNSDSLGDNFIGAHKSQLTTSAIDCSRFSSVFLQFQTHIGTANLNAWENALLRIWDGNQWFEYQLFPALKRNNTISLSSNSTIISLDITEATAGKDAIYIQWQWRGKAELAWSLDDIQLSNHDPAAPERSIWFERFNFNQGEWNVNPISPPISRWAWEATGDVSKGALAAPGTAIQSTTALDGAMVFNADFLTSGGLVTNLPPSPPYPQYIGEIISPNIDLTGIDFPLGIQFDQLVRILNVAPGAPATSSGNQFITSFAYSNDGGQNWSEPINANPNLKSSTNSNPVNPLNNTSYFPIPYVPNASSIQVKFTWAGDFYYWVLDDIALLRRPDFDLSLNNSFFSIMPNAQTPLSQLSSTPFIIDLNNIGGRPVENVALSLNITQSDTRAIIYQHTQNFESLAIDSTIENLILDNSLSPENIPSTGQYEGKYFISLDSTVSFPENDTLNWSFQITDTTFAKELGPTRDIASSENPSYTYGNCFFVPKGEDWYARFVTFGVANAFQLRGQQVRTFLYQWTGDQNDDQLATSDEYIGPLAINSYSFRGDEDGELITIPINTMGIGVPLEDNTYYFVVVEYESLNNQRCFFLASDQFNYQATFFATDSLNMNRYASVVDVGNTGTFSMLGFGLNVVPSIRLHIGDNPNLSGPATNIRKVEIVQNFTVYPNPAHRQFTIDYTLNPDIANAKVEILDVSGKSIYQAKIKNISSAKILIDSKNWESGIYFLNIAAKNRRKVKKLIISNTY